MLLITATKKKQNENQIDQNMITIFKYLDETKHENKKIESNKILLII